MMRATVTGKNADGTTFSFEQVAEPKVIASGVNKGEAREHDLGDFLSHLSKQITRATEPFRAPIVQIRRRSSSRSPTDVESVRGWEFNREAAPAHQPLPDPTRFFNLS